MMHRRMQKLFQKDRTSDITNNRMTILKNKKGFLERGWQKKKKKKLVYFLRLFRKLFFPGLQEKKYFECDVEEELELSWGWIRTVCISGVCI